MLCKRLIINSAGKRFFSRYAPAYSSVKEFDYLVVGGGSGGLASSRKAAQLGYNVGVIEERGKFGGTCVNVGCIPKKVMYNAGIHLDFIKTHKNYCFDVEYKGWDWGEMKKVRDAFIQSKNDMFTGYLKTDKVTSIFGRGVFTEDGCVEVNGQKYKGKKTLISTGARPMYLDVPGKELGIDNEGFFQLTKQPKKAVIVGSGYIGVELAGILRQFGSDVTMIIRPDDGVLWTFDQMVIDVVTQNLVDSGIKLATDTRVSSISKAADGKLNIKTTTGDINDADCLVWAVGRVPNSNIGLDKIGVKMDAGGNIKVDEYQNTNVPNVYAIGDVCGKALLTPVAIQAGRRLARRLFNGEDIKLDYEMIPSVIFAHPPVGTIGMSQAQAEQKYGADKIKCYRTCNHVYYGPSDRQYMCNIKMVCLKPDEKVLGLHMVSMDADEMMQGFATAVRMGATKEDFDNTIAIHPTISEEVVTMK